MNILYGERDWVSSHARQTSIKDGIKSGHSNKIGIANINSIRAEQSAIAAAAAAAAATRKDRSSHFHWRQKVAGRSW